MGCSNNGGNDNYCTLYQYQQRVRFILDNMYELLNVL